MSNWIITIIFVMGISIVLAGLSLKGNQDNGILCGIEIVIAFFIVIVGLAISAVIVITKFLL